MNGFTKDELECLHNAIALQLRDTPMSETNVIRRRELVGKLQSMIDDYPKCDHRSGLGNYNEKGDRVTYESDIFRCRYCDMLFKFIFNNGECVGHEDLE